MGILKLFERPAKPPLRIPNGCFSIDPQGNVLSRTLPASFPQELLAEIGHVVLSTFREAKGAKLTFAELNIHFPSLRITARELGGGALVFLLPLMMSSTDSSH